MTIAVGNDAEWQSLCRAIGNPQWVSDPRFADGYLRYKNRDALDHLMEVWTQGHTPQKAAELLQRAGVAAAPSMSILDLNEDAHLKARGAWQEVQHPVLGPQKVQGAPWKLSGRPLSSALPDPCWATQPSGAPRALGRVSGGGRGVGFHRDCSLDGSH